MMPNFAFAFMGKSKTDRGPATALSTARTPSKYLPGNNLPTNNFGDQASTSKTECISLIRLSSLDLIDKNFDHL